MISSGEAFYQLLEARFHAGEQLDADDFMPKVATSIAHHLRLNESATADTALARERLLQEVGLEEAVFRLSGLPALLPDCLIAAAVALNAEGFAKLFGRLRQRCLTPTSRMALFHLVAQRTAHHFSDQESLAVQVRDELLDPSTGREVFERVYGVAPVDVRALAAQPRDASLASVDVPRCSVVPCLPDPQFSPPCPREAGNRREEFHHGFSAAAAIRSTGACRDHGRRYCLSAHAMERPAGPGIGSGSGHPSAGAGDPA